VKRAHEPAGGRVRDGHDARNDGPGAHGEQRSRKSQQLVARVTVGERRFRLELASGGRIRLRVRRDPPAAPVETSWIGV
jgi:hypothetical protein